MVEKGKVKKSKHLNHARKGKRMKRSAKLMGLVVFLAVVLTGVTLFAQQPGRKGGTTAPAVGRLPDLTVERIYLVKDCRVAVRVKNLGPGIVPDEVWTVHTPKSAGVYFYINGKGWGGASIWKFDPTKKLQKPGGTATYVSKSKVSGSATIKTVVDLWNVVTEKNENNNSLEKKLICKPVVGKCCIAGTYDGIHKDIQSPTCPNPETEKFVLVITQANCGSTIKGEVRTIKNGTPTLTHYLAGAVTPAGKCCKIKGVLKGIPGTPTAGEVINIKATLCKKGGKWYSNNGAYNNPTGCSGTFTLKQQ